MTRRRFAVVPVLVLALLAAVAAVSTTDAQGRKGVKAATGPFAYDPAVAGSGTFLGTAVTALSGGFQVCAPGGGTIFPAGAASAVADIRVFGIDQVADADGTPLAEPLSVPLDSPLGSQIAGAFVLAPGVHEFFPGSCVDVEVTVSNPMVASDDFGDYVVTLKAQAIGSGIGVGSGSRFNLSLRPATTVDETPPDVVIDSPAGGTTHILGPISVQVRANDPAPGTGVQSMDVTFETAGGTDVTSQFALASVDVPKPAGEDATLLGTFTPVGGSGPAGTTSDGAFTSLARSGIGSYKLTATAIDGASNEGEATANFQVRYDVQFTEQSGQVNQGQPANSQGRFKFTVKRSDGTFMYDHTVVVQLVRDSDSAVMATHVFGAGGGVQEEVLITATPEYQTTFRRGDLTGPPTTSAAYKARVFFLDVDNNPVQQGESSAVTF